MAGFTPIEGESYFMPAHFGPRTQDWDGLYEATTQTLILFATDPEAAARLLPEGFEVADPAVVSIVHAENRGVRVLAGGGYNLVGVNIAARYKGRRDDVSGSYSLVMWENRFLPVMLGREFLGVPKLMAEIPDAWTEGNTRGFSVSEDGARLLEGTADGLTELDAAGVDEVRRQLSEGKWMAWRFFSTLDTAGTELSYPTAIDLDRTIDRAWLGAGEIRFFEPTRREAPLSYALASVLARLPVVQQLMAVVTEGSLVQGFAHKLQ